MRELHVVATSEDGRHVVLATRNEAVSGEFRVAIDDRLIAAVRGDLPRPGETEPAAVTPKEIQARLRLGESVEEIAASAGVPVAKIERYAGPVLSERERVITQARAGVVSRSRLGDSALPLGQAVDRHLADTAGVRLETVEWSARREDTGSWLVKLSYVSQARRRSATWRYDVARREVTATDAQSGALAHVEAGARRSRTPEHGAAHVPPARPAARRSTPARTAPKAVAAGKAAPKAAEKKAKAEAVRKAKAEAEKKAKAEAVRKAKAETEKKAKAEAVRKAKAEAARKAKAEAARQAKEQVEAARVFEEAELAREAETPTGPPTLRVVGGADEPAAPAHRGPKEPPAAARTAPARAAGQRASVPGWADVLLSTAPVARQADLNADQD